MAQPEPGPQTERPFGGNVDGIGAERAHPRDRTPRIASDPKFAVQRQRHGAMAVARHDEHLGANPFEVSHQLRQRVDDAVGLRMPGVCHKRETRDAGHSQVTPHLGRGKSVADGSTPAVMMV